MIKPDFSHSRILIWYRMDLRLHDHQPLQQAIATVSARHGEIIPIYCFDPRQFGTTSFGFPKTGGFRAQFLLESVANLQQSLRQIGNDLLIRAGLPEKIIPELAQQLGVTAVYYHQGVTTEERAIEAALKTALATIDVTLQGFWGQTLYHPDDLPFAIADLPELFTHFRQQVEKSAIVRPPLPAPQSLPPLPDVDVGSIPSLSDLSFEPPQVSDRAKTRFSGGETAGQDRVNAYIWQSDRLKIYKETRNGMLAVDDSSKFSPWLAHGCLSPRYLYQQVQEYEVQRVKNDSTYWLIFELLWRDYFRFICAKHGNRVFQASGLQGISIPWKQDWQQFDLWRFGKTGFPLVDANMRELLVTGFMSNRGRQNVASFLTKNLGIDWRMGAEWFESLLIDYDVCSNYGNWNYTAGVGNDARGFRFFNILKQSNDYDPKGEYVKYWLPKLARIPVHKVHTPWMLLPIEQQRFGAKIGVDYPQPIVDLMESAAENKAIYTAALSRRHSPNL
jgi:deoxyribodipyrimidine photo-lyase